MKLTKAQQEVLTDAKQSIDMARSYETYEEYEYNTNHFWRGRYTFEEAKELIKRNDESGFYRGWYEKRRRGITLVTANTKTITKLAEYGLIEVINEGRTYPDTIRVIGY